MDPNETLRQLRHVVQLNNQDNLITDDHTLDYVLERVQALDTWLTDGGFLPDDWAGLSQMRQSDVERLQKEKTENL